MRALSFNQKKGLSYIGLLLVVVIWGICPLLSLELYEFYSPTFRPVLPLTIITVVYLLMARKQLPTFHRDYLKYGIPAGLFTGMGSIAQNIGLQYTTPSRYAFLENLSCLTVPIAMFFLVRKKPTLPTVLSCVACMISAFVLNGMGKEDSGAMWGIGEVLCSLAGLFYGLNIAVTGAYVKKMSVPLYLLVQSTVETLSHLAFSLVFHWVRIPVVGGGIAPIEQIKFSFEPKHIAYLIFVSLLASAFCWAIRAASMRYVDPAVVAVVMPFSAVITSVVSILLGKESLTFSLVVGGILGLVAIYLSSYEDIVAFWKHKKAEPKIRKEK